MSSFTTQITDVLRWPGKRKRMEKNAFAYRRRSELNACTEYMLFRVIYRLFSSPFAVGNRTGCVRDIRRSSMLLCRMSAHSFSYLILFRCTSAVLFFHRSSLWRCNRWTSANMLFDIFITFRWLRLQVHLFCSFSLFHTENHIRFIYFLRFPGCVRCQAALHIVI